MKINVKDTSYTVIAVVSETVTVTEKPEGKLIKTTTTKDVMKAVVYCYDKERKIHRFLMDDVTRVDS